MKPKGVHGAVSGTAAPCTPWSGLAAGRPGEEEAALVTIQDASGANLARPARRARYKRLPAACAGTTRGTSAASRVAIQNVFAKKKDRLLTAAIACTKKSRFDYRARKNRFAKEFVVKNITALGEITCRKMPLLHR